MRYLKIISLFLAMVMIVSAFAACGNNENQTDSHENETTSMESSSSETSSGESDSEETGAESTELETMGPSTPAEVSDWIKDANALANGVSAHYTDGSRKDYLINNKNMTMHLGLGGDGCKAIRSIKNKNGGTYIENTMDVYAVVNGVKYSFSNNPEKARANIYRLGYYFYDVHVLDQSLVDVTAIESQHDIEISEDNLFEICDVSPVYSDNEVVYKVTSINDPNIAFKSDYAAAAYNCISFKMKANAASVGTIFICAGSNALFSGSQSLSFNIINDGEYHTYVVDISGIPDYNGTVKGIRFDVGHSDGETIGIKDLKAVKVNTDVPELYLDRTLNTYSDKLNQVIHIVAKEKTTDIDAVGMITRISADTVNKIIVKDKNGLRVSVKGVDWESAEYIAFDIKNAGIFGYILPDHKESGGFAVTLEDGYYVIDQSSAPVGNRLAANGGFYMGQRIYTDESHSFDAFLKEAEYERNPLETLSVTDDSGECRYIGYDPLRGAYRFEVKGSDFNKAYSKEPDKHYKVAALIKGADVDRKIYVYTYTISGSLEGAAVLDSNNILLPIPTEVCKNFCGENEEPLFDYGDKPYGEVYLPVTVKAGENLEFTVLNLYQNWGRQPLKQLSAIQYYAPYYHLSTGVTETNCISMYYGRSKTLSTLPDHRAMSAPMWENQPQHTAGGMHTFLVYKDKNDLYSASETRAHNIISSGLTYADISMGYMSDDGRIRATYEHIEIPQTDENRTYYVMKYEILEDIEFDNFKDDFQFYSIQGIHAPYEYISYLDEDNEFNKTKNSSSRARYYKLGTVAPYFAMYGADHQDYVNLSCIINDWNIVIGGEKYTGNWMIKNDNSTCRLTLDLEEVTLKAGDTIEFTMILTPWGYTWSKDDKNVREIREDSCLNPTIVTSDTDYIIDSAFMPKIRSKDGESAIFNISGGPDRMSVRVYGFSKLGSLRVYELRDGEWNKVPIASLNEYDGYSVFYDEDGTLSYSFVFQMKAGRNRTFKVVVE